MIYAVPRCYCGMLHAMRSAYAHWLMSLGSNNPKAERWGSRLSSSRRQAALAACACAEPSL
ncbi:MAG TPA: hypothetical protein VGP15_14840, partial [Burkholderiales bacterium]|nr:hypothetical protein [Burkholderiales bacterium]